MSKIVSFEEVETVMDRMMQTPICKFLDKQEFNYNKNIGNEFDPNLIMDARHNFLRKSTFLKNNVQTQPKSFLEVDLDVIRKARENHLLELELRRFEKNLLNARPKFQQHKMCKKNVIANSDDDIFWNGAISSNNHKYNNKNDTNQSKEVSNTETESENSNSCFTNIKVLIRDKSPIIDSTKENEEILKKVFQIIKEHVKEKKYYRNLKLKVQQNIANKLLQRYFEVWKSYTEKIRKIALKKKEEIEMTHERKIEMFVNAIAKKQEELVKLQKPSKKDFRIKSAPEVSVRSTVLVRQVCVVESPAQNRLKVQQKIIEEQRIRLTKQRQIIEELQLKEFQNESKKISIKTLETAKEVLEYCGPAMRRTLLQLIREKGHSTKFQEKELRVPSPPEFLMRMEARAEARRERVKKSKEAREKRLEEEKQLEELTRKKQEDERRELRLEAQREAKRIRKEQEKQKILQMERQRMICEKIDQFYQRYLLKRYIMFPFKALIEVKHLYEARAIKHYNRSLLKKSLSLWHLFAKIKLESKLDEAVSFSNKKLSLHVFFKWKQFVLDTRKSSQVAYDFYDMKLQTHVIKWWKFYIIEKKAIYLKKKQIAIVHYEKKLLIKSFVGWKKYLEIAEELRESEQRKEELRALVQQMVPDFDPKYRGVAIDD